ncbi:MAG: ABC transporter ATP-binding protein [Clostridia bacterium]|nr:ABC transporter ATP-binding protein [Clostridia bacterium]
MSENKRLEKGAGRGVVLRLMKLMTPYLPAIALCVLCVLLVNAAQLVKPYVLKIVVDDYLTAGIDRGVQPLIALGLVYFAVIALGSLAGMFQSRILSRVCQKILATLRVQAFDHIHRMPLADMDDMGSGRLLTRSTNDIETLNEFYVDVLIGLFKDVFLIAGIVVMMFAMSWRLALMGLVTLPLIILITLLCKGALRRNFVRMKALIGRINGFLSESISGIRVIQAFSREKNKYDQLYDLDRQYRKTTLFQVTMNSVMRPLMEFINIGATAILLLYAFGRVETGVIEVGVIVAFNSYIRQFFDPINDLAEKYNSVQSALVSADRVFSLLDDDANLEQPDAPGYDETMRGRVEFRHVWFAYVGEEWVLRDVSFTVNPGEKAAFVGATGAGKTTIISLISRFYRPQKGEILIDGVPVEEWKLSALRKQISVVLQDVFLFTGTIADNVRIHGDIDDAQVARAIELSCADGFVKRLPDGMNAPVAERGATFSTGERQLLSFARAIAHDPAILVLDEATANIDSETERVIQRSIESISKGRTALFIAHRLSTIRACDAIYVLEHGQIVEQGTHEELMAKGGLYASMSAVQEAETAS